jgi:hypothetical protein
VQRMRERDEIEKRKGEKEMNGLGVGEKER